jgi:glutamate/tyrosine decarboxylase-like PLP-dependent enzyme
VNTGAIDDLDALAALAAREGLWFHVDGAVGALTALSPELRPRLRGMERADSVAFDLHKWGYIPYEAGCVIVREKEQGRHAFRAAADYLAPHQAGVSGRSDRFADLGVELSRGFKALKVWMSLKSEGADKLGRLMVQNTEQAQHLARRVRQSPELELLAPVPLNIVCFRYAKGGDLDRRNQRILIRLHQEGTAVPSYTRLGGRYALRVAITNHRTRREDLDLLVDEVVRLGREPGA